jgi:HK97 family phage prohead protease
MEHLLLKAATTATTDQGTFTAVISTESVDRELDVVSADAMVTALHKWNRPVPLAWNHSTKAEDIFGSIDPQSAKNINGEVVVDGKVDLESRVGAEAWRSVKSGTLGFSFGYIVLQSTARKGGGRHITGVDVFEVTGTPTPMNNDTRVLSFKRVTDAPPTATQLRILNSMIGQAQEYVATEPDPEDAAEMAAVLEVLEELRGEPGTGDEADGQEMAGPMKSVDEPGKGGPSEARSVDSLRKTALDLALEIQSRGLGSEPPRKQAPPPPRPSSGIDPNQLREETRALLIQVLSKTEEQS